MLAIVSLIILILIFGVIFLHYSSELAFKRIFLKHKKNKEEAFLEGKNGEDIYIGLHGQSLGGATVLMCGVNNNKVKFIIDDCGFSNGKEEIKHEFDKQRYIPFKPVYWLLRKKIKCRCNFDMDEVNPLKEIQNSNKPILFIHGKEDKLVPYTMAEDMYNKRANKEDILYLVEDADHMECYGANREKYEEVVRKFISKVNGEN